MRTQVVNQIPGGMWKIFSVVLKELFVDGPLADIGLHLETPAGRTLRLFAKLGYFIQDGAAHKQTWHCKGDAGCKLCVLCRNVFSAASEVVEDGEEVLCCNAKKYADLDLATSEDLQWAVRRLNELHDDPAISPDEFAIRKKALASLGHPIICLETDHWMIIWMHPTNSSTTGCIWFL